MLQRTATEFDDVFGAARVFAAKALAQRSGLHHGNAMGQGVAIRLRMRWIPPGRYLRGSGDDDPDAFANEKPQHEVVLTHGFWLSDAPVTQAVWVAVMGDNPSRFEGATRPVERVSWEDCQRFCARLSRLCPGLHPRLPTEAEWEYAARAGTPTPRYGELDDIAWYRGTSSRRTGPVWPTHPVRQKQLNPWGFYGMLGNVWEWCQDRADLSESYPADAERQVDPLGTDGAQRGCRGGARHNVAPLVRTAFRWARGPSFRSDDLGFRLAGARAIRGGASDVGADAGGDRPPRGGASPEDPAGGPPSGLDRGEP